MAAADTWMSSNSMTSTGKNSIGEVSNWHSIVFDAGTFGIIADKSTGIAEGDVGAAI